jgi:DNA polymerase-3 subunit alpha
MKIENENLTDPSGTKLEELALEGLERRVADILAKYPEHDTEQQVYWDRLFSELDIIMQVQLSGHFLMISDIVTWAKDNGIPVGPGRGPIVGSLVAYAIGITDVDPLRYNLLFERCLSSEHRIMRDVDIDFCIDRRDEVVQYAMKKYGGDLDNDGCRLRTHLPVKHDHAVSYVTQAEMKHVEAARPVMLNFQGLKHLTTISKAVQLIRAGKSPDFDFANLRDDDQETFQLMAFGNTENTFQFESDGITDFIRQLKPGCFEDLIAVISLYRPVPIESGMADDVIKRKHEHRKDVYELPQLVPLLKNTYGATIYQEQFMEIFRIIGGFSLGEADLLRRGLIKMNAAAISIKRDRFVAGAREQEICSETAAIIFDRMAQYGEHYFLKAHAAAYATISYQSAYLKAHYPEEFNTAFRSQ